MPLLGYLLARADEEQFPTTGGIGNGTCTKERSLLDGPALFQHGDLVFQAHDVTIVLCADRLEADSTNTQVGWIVCAFFSMVATVTSFWLIGKHLRWYTNVSRKPPSGEH
jgi:hypothetical protein